MTMQYGKFNKLLHLSGNIIHALDFLERQKKLKTKEFDVRIS